MESNASITIESESTPKSPTPMKRTITEALNTNFSNSTLPVSNLKKTRLKFKLSKTIAVFQPPSITSVLTQPVVTDFGVMSLPKRNIMADNTNMAIANLTNEIVQLRADFAKEREQW
ncbi:hypothetical protein EC973_009573, partial [Apophysomyces ossiformis]